MPRPRSDPRIEPPPLSALEARAHAEDASLLSGLVVDGVQTDGARAAENRAMVTRMRAREEGSSRRAVAQEAARLRSLWTATTTADRADRPLSAEALRQVAQLRGAFGIVPHAARKDTGKEHP